MADFANAVVKFKLKEKFREAFQIVFDRMADKSLLYWDFGFDCITKDGRYTEEYDEDAEYLEDNARIGCYFNLEGEFSIPFTQGITGNEVTLCFAKKWGTLETLRSVIESFLYDTAEEVYFCEMIGLFQIDFDAPVDCYRISYEAKKNADSDWFHLTEKKREKIT